MKINLWSSQCSSTGVQSEPALATDQLPCNHFFKIKEHRQYQSTMKLLILHWQNGFIVPSTKEFMKECDGNKRKNLS